MNPSRARATALTLVNWKGVFFEHYWLDRHVTALEGANGAGKTTVMIAAYVVLLPDLTRLRFVNLGESGPSGGDRGIWGRLGEAGPSYAALEVDPGDGQRVALGVLLERKAAPSLALTPFLISGFSPTQAVRPLFLDERNGHEQIRSLQELEQQVQSAGLSIEVFGSSKEYFSSLFERGISPLRLGTDEEKNKWNEMLKTSMTGGISRTLTTDLRSFLFKQESGLSDTLSRMHKNLDACRRTRIEVSEARTLEHEVRGVASAGRAMLEAVIDAGREQARESRERREQAERRHAAELASAAEHQTRLAEAELKQQGLGPRLERAKLAESRAREHLAAVERALASAKRAAQLEEERQRLEPGARLALEHKASASAGRQRAKLDRDAAQQTLLVAASGLGSWQAGLDELHRQANAHRRLRSELRRARSELAHVLDAPGGALDASETEQLRRAQRAVERWIGADTSPAAPGEDTRADASAAGLARESAALVRAVLRSVDRGRAERDRDAELAERRRAAQAEAAAALSMLTGAPPDGELRARAERELARLAELEMLSRRLPELRAERQRQLALEERRRALHAELDALGGPKLESAAEFVAYLGELEGLLRGAERARRDHELGAERATHDAARARERILALEARRDTYARLQEHARRARARGAEAPSTRADMIAALRESDEARHVLATRAAELAAQCQDALARALECEAMLATADAPLAQLAELCEGQLLAARYDELDAEAARRVQAELGPLTDAIVVDDPERALARVLSQHATSADVWLVRAGAELPAATPAVASAGAADAEARVVVDVGFGLRVSSLPRSATLGRAARARRAEALRAEAEAANRASADLTARQRDERAARADLEALQEHWDVWILGDPQPELERARTELSALLGAQSEAERLAREQRIEIARLEARRDALRAQLPRHHLLDPPEHAGSASLRASLEQAEGAAAELNRAASARSILLAHIHDLEPPAPDAAAILAWRAERAALDERRHQLFAAAEALDQVEAGSAAFAWSEAEAALAERAALVPELEAQHRRAEQELARAQQALDAAELAWEQATERAQAAAAALTALDAHAARARSELAAESAHGADALSLEHAQAEVTRQAEACAELRRSESGAHAEVALCRERAAEAERRVRAAARELELERERELPAAREWQDLAAAAREAQAWAAARGSAEPGAEQAASGLRIEGHSAASSQERWLQARAKCELLGERLAHARGGAELAASVRDALTNELATAPREARGRFLALWSELEAWLARRLPAGLSDSGGPLAGLERLETDLAELERRLERQEGDLRGTSGDVARSIDVQLRRASSQLRRLNRSLEGISFGSIHAIRVQMDRVDKMDRILAALREGETQELLFQSNLPIEAALDEIFRRHAGGRSGGQRLLDFREYLELSVQIQRRPEQSWERVSASQVSTGEAIGIGAALMMVILTEWEQSDQLLRRPRQHGSLRFLFLDEANRLSQDNLGVLFDLCQNLDLQLLIAAPEVARAEGNTTYRLVRRVSDDGREEVLVTGRRSSLPEARPANGASSSASDHDTAPAEPPRAEQVALFGE